MLGLCYELGRGVAEDKGKAAECYRMAAHWARDRPRWAAWR